MREGRECFVGVRGDAGDLGFAGGGVFGYEFAHGHLPHGYGDAVDATLDAGAKVGTLEGVVCSKVSRPFGD
jgi:hypothetical protein